MKFISRGFIFFMLYTATNYCEAQPRVAAAKDILKEAYARAGREGKQVFVIFHASWCGWCHKMDSSMLDKSCRKFFDDSYITCHLTVDESKGKKYLENPGAAQFREKFNGQREGIPFWLVLDKDARLLADSRICPEGKSFDAAGDNAGCPASKEEVAYFIRVLKKTSRLSDSALSVIAKRFAKNAAP